GGPGGPNAAQGVVHSTAVHVLAVGADPVAVEAPARRAWLTLGTPRACRAGLAERSRGPRRTWRTCRTRRTGRSGGTRGTGGARLADQAFRTSRADGAGRTSRADLSLDSLRSGSAGSPVITALTLRTWGTGRAFRPWRSGKRAGRDVGPESRHLGGHGSEAVADRVLTAQNLGVYGSNRVREQ